MGDQYSVKQDCEGNAQWHHSVCRKFRHRSKRQPDVLFCSYILDNLLFPLPRWEKDSASGWNTWSSLSQSVHPYPPPLAHWVLGSATGCSLWDVNNPWMPGQLRGRISLFHWTGTHDAVHWSRCLEQAVRAWEKKLRGAESAEKQRNPFCLSPDSGFSWKQSSIPRANKFPFAFIWFKLVFITRYSESYLRKSICLTHSSSKRFWNEFMNQAYVCL